jgi:hypothetical protein
VLRATVDPFGVNPGEVIVVVNHLRSFIDIELVSGEGVRVRAKRTAQAEAIAELLQDLQQQNPNMPVISVGDYNAYEFSDGYTDPISVLKGTPPPTDQIVAQQSPDAVDPDYVNLTDSLPRSERYSFIFEGTPQALDHVLLNTVARRYFQRYAIARNNADFPAAPGLPGDGSRPERNSDHDMPVAYFAFPGTPVVTLNGSATMTVEAFTSFADPGATAHDDTGPLPVAVAGKVDVNVPGEYTLTHREQWIQVGQRHARRPGIRHDRAIDHRCARVAGNTRFTESSDGDGVRSVLGERRLRDSSLCDLGDQQRAERRHR